MYLKTRKPSTDPRLRSLLQKAVRRGVVPLVNCVAARLDSIGDTTWLRSRTVVITFEECWPLGGKLSLSRTLSSKLDALTSVAESPKQKDAAGLGALAYAHREGDSSMLAYVPDVFVLRTVARALDRPDAFFRWILNDRAARCHSDTVLAAQKYLAVATWGWDKACILAGALLSTLSPLPTLTSPTPRGTLRDFPYWTALDKHTDEGKAALRDVAKVMKVKYRQLIWTSFYLESARVNDLMPSPWFAAERSWRLARANITSEEAQELWSSASPLIQQRLIGEAAALKRLVETASRDQIGSTQTALL